MEITITIPEYSGEGIRLYWKGGFEIEVKTSNREIVVSANKERLISLAKHLLSLIQDSVPTHHHFHLDEYNVLEEGSTPLVFQKK